MEEKKIALTKMIATFIVSIDADTIEDNIFDHVKIAFKDWMAVTFAAKNDPTVKKLINYANMLGGNKQATIVGYNTKTDISNASLINGTASHVLDYDDTLAVFLGHPSVTIFPSILALAEWKETSGKEFLTAYLAGLKAGTIIGGCGGFEHYMAGWHATSTLGHFASAAGCAKLLHLDEQRIVHALGIAGTQASGLKRVFGSMCKPFHAGKAAQAGLIAGLLAEDGFTSADDILEGEHGFFNVLKGSVNETVVENMALSWEIENMAQKYHASCHATHSPIEAARKILLKEKINTNDIKEIVISSSKLALDAATKRIPTVGSEGKFSIPYCVANALIHENTGMQAFSDERIKDPRVLSLLDRIHVQLNENYLGLEAEARIITTSGAEYREYSDILQEIPSLNDKKEKIHSKFTDLCSPHLGDFKTDALEKAIDSLDDISNIKDLMTIVND